MIMLSLPTAAPRLASGAPRRASRPGRRASALPCRAVLGRRSESAPRGVNGPSGGKRDWDEALEHALENYLTKERPNENKTVSSPFADVTDRVPSGDGWTFEAVVPGLGSEDIHIDLDPAESTVRVQGVDGRLHRKFDMAMPVPEGADWSGIHATCKDGILLIHVPREEPSASPPPEASASSGEYRTGGLEAGSLQHFAVDVPGLRAADIKVEVDADEGYLHILGKSTIDPRYDIDRRFKVSPNVDSEHIEGSCTDGVLRLSLPITAPRRVVLRVTTDPLNDDDASHFLFVYHAAAPGIQAKDLTAVVAGDHLLLHGVRHGGSAGPAGGELRRKIPLPFPVPHPEKIYVSLADGLINVAVPPAALGRDGDALIAKKGGDAGQAGKQRLPVGGIGGSPGGPGGRKTRANKLGKL